MPATKRFTVHRTSNVLTVSLKRFANFSGGKITKVGSTFCFLTVSFFRFNPSFFSDQMILLGVFFQDVGYPEFLNIRPYMSQSSGDPVMYGLYAVLVHSGYSCHAGHYYCYVKVSWRGGQSALEVVVVLINEVKHFEASCNLVANFFFKVTL